MADEYIRKADAIKQCGFGMTSLHIADNLRKMRPADVVPICQTGCKGCKRENNLVVGSCSLCARFYEDMYEGINNG